MEVQIQIFVRASIFYQIGMRICRCCFFLFWTLLQSETSFSHCPRAKLQIRQANKLFAQYVNQTQQLHLLLCPVDTGTVITAFKHGVQMLCHSAVLNAVSL